ncbi:uncharacterized protein NPIL_639101 [Nephila pilipes]|uniref:Uncharacterized protein n=1 Tax=Nephila pilipes TaxID=299642 RepID=A0A8X6QI17_NEPPI|nr:uncharacterized protein NPIL_639101 [Nephila pilipes]
MLSGADKGSLSLGTGLNCCRSNGRGTIELRIISTFVAKMDVKRRALFLIFLVSSNYVGVAMGQGFCQPSPRLEQLFRRCLDQARAQMEDSYTLQDNTVGNVQLTGGRVTGVKNCRITPPVTCACNRDSVNIYINLSFLDVTVTFLVTLLDDLLGGLVGQLGSNLARLVGQVVNLLVSLLALEINVVITVEQRFIPGSTCTVTNFRVTRISEIRLLSLNLTPLLGGLLTPIVDTLLRNLMERQVRPIITSEFQKVTVTRDMFTCSVA